MNQKPIILFLAVLLASLCLRTSAATPTQGALLLDVSESMSGNDPKQLRWDGLLTLVKLLELSRVNKLSVHYFADQDVCPIPPTLVSSESYPRFAALANEPLNAGGTDLTPALRSALAELRSTPGLRYVIVVSDGDFSSKSLEALGEELKQVGAPLFFIRLRKDPGRKIEAGMQAIITRTGGTVYDIATRQGGGGADILTACLDIFSRLAPPTLTLLTDEKGGFSLDRSHRSFVVLAPSGAEIGLVSPRGLTTWRASDRAFQDWKLATAQRPLGQQSTPDWDEGSWKLIDRRTGRPIANAHVYIHGDIALADPKGAVFQALAGERAALSLPLVVDAPKEWSQFEDSTANISRLRGTFLMGGKDRGLLPVPLEISAGALHGETPWTVPVGRYLGAIELTSASGNPVARVENVPLQVDPNPFVWDLATRNRGETTWTALAFDASTNEQIAPISVSASARLRISLRSADASALSSLRIIEQASLALVEPGATAPRIIPLHPVAGGMAGAFETDADFILPRGGLHRAEIEIGGRIVHQEKDQMARGAATRTTRFTVKLPLRPFKVEAARSIAVEWVGAGEIETIGIDQVKRFSGRIVAQGIPADLRGLVSALQSATITWDLQGPDGRHLRSEGAKSRFEALRVEPASGGLTFSGAYFGDLGPGTYRLRPEATIRDARGNPLTIEGEPLVWKTSELPLGKLMITRREGGRDIRLVDNLSGPNAQLERAYDSHRFQVTLTAVGGSRRLTREPPVIELIKGSRRQRLQVTVNDQSAVAEIPPLEIGQYQIEARALWTPQAETRERVELQVEPTPAIPPTRLKVEWLSSTEDVRSGLGWSFAADQVIPFKGIIKVIPGSETVATNLADVVATGGLTLAFETAEKRYTSLSDAGFWRNVVFEKTPGAISFSGAYIGPKLPGRSALNVHLDPGIRTLQLTASSLPVAVMEPILALELTAQRVNRPLRQMIGPQGEVAPLFDDQNLSFVFSLTPSGQARGLGRYRMCNVIFSSKGVQLLRLDRPESPKTSLAIGNHPAGDYELLLNVLLEDGVEIYRHLALAIHRSPKSDPSLLSLNYFPLPKTSYYANQLATVGGQATFGTGSREDQDDWISQCEAVLIATSKAGAQPVFTATRSFIFTPARDAYRFSVDVPTEIKGAYGLTLALRPAEGNPPGSPPDLARLMASTNPVPCQIETSFSYYVEQGGRRLYDSTVASAAATTPVHPNQPLEVIMEAAPSLVVSRAQSPTLKIQRPDATPEIAVFNANSANAREFRLTLPAQGKGAIALKFETLIEPAGGTEPLRLTRTLTLVGRAPTWPLWLLAGVAASFVGLVAWYWPGLWELIRRRPAPLHADITVAQPRIEATIPIVVQSSLKQRLHNRGRAVQILRIGAGGHHPLPGGFGLDGAWLEFEPRGRGRGPRVVAIRRHWNPSAPPINLLEGTIAPLFANDEVEIRAAADLAMPLALTIEGYKKPIAYINFTVTHS